MLKNELLELAEDIFSKTLDTYKISIENSFFLKEDSGKFVFVSPDRIKFQEKYWIGLNIILSNNKRPGLGSGYSGDNFYLGEIEILREMYNFIFRLKREYPTSDIFYKINLNKIEISIIEKEVSKNLLFNVDKFQKLISEDCGYAYDNGIVIKNFLLKEYESSDDKRYSHLKFRFIGDPKTKGNMGDIKDFITLYTKRILDHIESSSSVGIKNLIIKKKQDLLDVTYIFQEKLDGDLCREIIEIKFSINDPIKVKHFFSTYLIYNSGTIYIDIKNV